MVNTIMAMDAASPQRARCFVLRDGDRRLLKIHGDVCGHGGIGIHLEMYLV
jgi:hypothetical protein